MEVKIKGLEAKLSEVKLSQCVSETEMERYKKAYLQELQMRKSREHELNM